MLHGEERISPVTSKNRLPEQSSVQCQYTVPNQTTSRQTHLQIGVWIACLILMNENGSLVNVKFAGCVPPGTGSDSKTWKTELRGQVAQTSCTGRYGAHLHLTNHSQSASTANCSIPNHQRPSHHTHIPSLCTCLCWFLGVTGLVLSSPCDTHAFHKLASM